MLLGKNGKGKKKQKKGIYIRLTDPNTTKSYSMTVHGMSLSQLRSEMRFFLTGISKVKGSYDIIVKERSD